MKNFILIGANSELATSFAEELKLNKFNIYSISRKVVPYLSENNQIQLEDYIENCKDILSFIKNIEDYRKLGVWKHYTVSGKLEKEEKFNY